MTLNVDEFIRRLPVAHPAQRFRRTRHFGFLANAHRTARLATIRALLNVPPPDLDVSQSDYRTRYASLTGGSLDICPCCGGPMIKNTILARTRRPSSSPIWCDSS
jgi:hypothetical protein